MFGLQEMAEEFLRECRAKNLSPRTVDFYQDNLRAFMRFLEGEGLPLRVDVATPMLLRRYVEHMGAKEGLSPGGVHARLRTLRAFYNFLKREEVVEKSPFEKFRLPKVPQVVMPVVQPEEFQLLLRVAMAGRNPLRDRAILLVLYDTGIRAMELVGLTLNDIGPDTLKVHGKGARDRFVPISRPTVRALRAYLRAERPASPLPQVFLVSQDAPLTYTSLHALLDRLFKEAGLPPKGAHAFRRGFAVQFIRGGGDTFSLQRILGHSSLEMSRRYAALSMRDVQDVHARVSPVLQAQHKWAWDER